MANDQIPGVDPTAAPSGDGCVECLEGGGWWLHLRRCAACGHIGCCDSSPGQHGTKHAREAGHPLLTSFEPGESWTWNIETEQYYEGLQLPEPTSHPASQPTPGPLGKVPADWQRQLH